MYLYVRPGVSRVGPAEGPSDGPGVLAPPISLRCGVCWSPAERRVRLGNEENVIHGALAALASALSVIQVCL